MLDTNLLAVLHALAADEPLAERHRDYPLLGEWAGFRDCHIKPDLVLIHENAGRCHFAACACGFHPLGWTVPPYSISVLRLRSLIRERTSEGRARAKANGKSLGRPFKLTPHQMREAVARRESGELLSDIARSYNVSAAAISRLGA